MWRGSVSAPEERGEYTSGWLPRLVRHEIARRLSGRKGMLLDIGCGEGLLFAKVCGASGEVDIVGIDTWDVILKNAAARRDAERPGRVRLARADSLALPFPDNTFEFVSCANIVYNLPDRQAVAGMFSEAVRVAKPGGSVFADFRNRLNPLVYFGYMLAPLHDPDIRVPLNSYRPGEIEGLFPEGRVARVGLSGLGMGLGLLSPVIMAEAVKE
jgi:ubiquinone/menaquinone biosynthesis C-methylase UbiE